MASLPGMQASPVAASVPPATTALEVPAVSAPVEAPVANEKPQPEEVTQQQQETQQQQTPQQTQQEQTQQEQTKQQQPQQQQTQEQTQQDQQTQQQQTQQEQTQQEQTQQEQTQQEQTQQEPTQQEQPPEPTPPPPQQMRVVLQNVTASISMRLVIDPASIASKVKNAEYNPKKLPACVMRIREPKATGLLFASGKVVVTGATGVEAAREAARKFVAVVESLQLKPAFTNFTVQNMVATAEMDYTINLELMAYSHARWCMYEPELFPGLVYQTARRGVVAHIFASGRVVLTGAKHEEHLNEALVHLLPILDQFRQPAEA